ncbi:MAG: glycosyl hydrolase family 18 protein [Candidatus Edwardsbacteria bacterium]|jgi:hypothetical protein|nr:glycosyl hydrolase family 18 protein [Candidatus Edwardsbacteria bacterium]
MRLIAILLAGTAMALAQGPAPKSIHQLQSEQYQSARGDKGPEQPIIPLSSAKSPRVGKVVYGYDPSWTADTYLHYDLLTHIACFSGAMHGNGSVSSGGFPGTWSATINLAHKNGVKVAFCTTCFDSDTIAAVLSSAANRTNAARNLVAMVRNAGCEGVNLDFEGLPVSQKQNLVRFVHELADSFHSWDPESHVSLATPAVDWSGAWDYDSLAIYADALFIMAYDYGWSGSDYTMPVAPLDGYSRDVLWTIHDYVTYSGNRRDKLLAGFPYYGYDWPCASSSPGAATTGGGSAVLYRYAAVNAMTYGRQWHGASSNPWYWYGSYHQCWYDDEVSLGCKYDAVWDSMLAGTGMWALAYDHDRHELWDLLRTSFNIPSDTFGNGGMEATFLDTAAVPTADSVRPSGWLEGANCIAVAAADYVHGGTRALKHCVDARGKAVPYLSFLFQDVAASPGTAYALSGWARKNDGAGNVMRMRLEWYDGSHQLLRDDSTAALSSDSSGYRFLTTGAVTAPSGTAFARIKLNIWVDSSNGYWDRWDDISFAPVTGAAGGPPIPMAVSELRLLPARPNPFRRFATIEYQIPESGMVHLVVYNIAGQRVRTLASSQQPAGSHTVRWDGRNENERMSASGIYLLRLVTPGGTLSRRVTLVR